MTNGIKRYRKDDIERVTADAKSMVSSKES